MSVESWHELQENTLCRKCGRIWDGNRQCDPHLLPHEESKPKAPYNLEKSNPRLPKEILSITNLHKTCDFCGKGNAVETGGGWFICREGCAESKLPIQRLEYFYPHRLFKWVYICANGSCDFILHSNVRIMYPQPWKCSVCNFLPIVCSNTDE